MDELSEEQAVETVGAKLRAAREAAKLSIEDIAAQTRIPTRHLESLEAGDWEKLPAPTYSIGFAKNYASVVGLDRAEIAEQLRYEMGGYHPAHIAPEVFEPADPSRAMPKWLVVAALAAVVLVVLAMSWLNRRQLEGDDTAPATAETAAPAASGPAVPAAPAPAAAGPVVLTANEPVWLQVKDGAQTLFQGELASGQSYEVPASAKAPTLSTGRPESIRVSVGTADAPAIGAPGKTVSGVSLLGPDLMKGASAASPPAAAQAAPAATPTRTAAPPRKAAPKRAIAPAPAKAEAVDAPVAAPTLADASAALPATNESGTARE